MADQEIDVAIIGGGPSGSTTGNQLNRYGPNLGVRPIEREQKPVFRLNVDGVTWKNRSEYRNGRVTEGVCRSREENGLPHGGTLGPIENMLQRSPVPGKILRLLQQGPKRDDADSHAGRLAMVKAIQALDEVFSDGRADCSHDPSKPLFRFDYKGASLGRSRNTVYALPERGREN